VFSCATPEYKITLRQVRKIVCQQQCSAAADEKPHSKRLFTVRSVASLPALGPWAPPSRTGPSLKSIYRVSLTVDLCEGNKIISFFKFTTASWGSLKKKEIWGLWARAQCAHLLRRPCVRCYASAVLAIALCLSVCNSVSVCHKWETFCRNRWTARADFWHMYRGPRAS